LWPTPRTKGLDGGANSRKAAKARGMWPTVTVSGNNNRRGLTAKAGDGLATAVRQWPTPTASDARHGGNPRRRGNGETLAVFARHFPTPTASAYKGWSAGHNRAQSNDRIDYTIEREAREAGQAGSLNPDWVEWLMGWPYGWTRLEPMNPDCLGAWRTFEAEWRASGAEWWWDSDPAIPHKLDMDKPSIPRVTTERRHRAARIVALGNGQVPRCAAAAFLMLGAA
jgi:hypothetical protein